MQLTYILALLGAIAILAYFLVSSIIYFPTTSLFHNVLEFLGIGLLVGGLLTNWYRNFSPVTIQELEKKKVYEIERGQISRIEMMDRGSLLWSKIIIVSKSGERRTTLFGENGSFKHARRLFQMFAPDLCVDVH